MLVELKPKVELLASTAVPKVLLETLLEPTMPLTPPSPLVAQDVLPSATSVVNRI